MSGPSVRVLVVDDYAPGRYARATLLRRAGFEVFEARNGVEALEQATAGRPHVVPEAHIGPESSYGMRAFLVHSASLAVGCLDIK